MTDMNAPELRDVHDELVELTGLAVALDHCMLATEIRHSTHSPSHSLSPLVSTIHGRLEALALKIERALTDGEAA